MLMADRSRRMGGSALFVLQLKDDLLTSPKAKGLRRGRHAMDSNTARPNLRTPRAAALAGTIFSVLTIAAFWLFWISVPVDPHDSGSWLTENSSTVAFGLNLIPSPTWPPQTPRELKRNADEQ
jgi:hypothetical protein